MDILERILSAGLPVLAILVVFAVVAYAEALKRTRRR
jgi:O-antigen ligase